MKGQIFRKLAAFVAISALSTVAMGAPIVADLEDQTNGGGFFATVTIADNGSNTVKITADIAAPINAGLTKGDILALWFDFANFGALSGTAAVTNPSTTILGTIAFGNNAVGASPAGFGANANLNGVGGSNWDFAVELGDNGNSLGFIQTVSFDLTITGLDQSQFLNQRVGMRVQSIEGDDDFTYAEGSSKLTGTGTGDDDPDPDPNPVPVPGTVLLLGLGLLGLRFARRTAV